jgi:hypothetical protein
MRALRVPRLGELSPLDAQLVLSDLWIRSYVASRPFPSMAQRDREKKQWNRRKQSGEKA